MIQQLTIPRRVWAQTGEGILNLAQGETWRGQDITVKLNLENEEIAISLSAETSALLRVFMAWDVNMPAAVRVLGDHWERAYGDLSFKGLVPERILPWYFIASLKEKNLALGVKTGCKAFCSWQLTRDNLVLCLDVRNGGSGVYLQGRTLEAAALVYAEGEGPLYTFARHFVQRLCPAPRMPKAPLYGGSNWCYTYGNSSAEDIMEDTRLMSSLSTHTGNRPHMFIDDGWGICMTGGPWHQGNHKFPDMPGLCAKMKAEGVNPGIWIRPLLNFSTWNHVWSLPRSRFLKGTQGRDISNFIDPSIPEALDWMVQDIVKIKSWGFEALKHDFTTHDLLGRWGFSMGAEMTTPGWSFTDQSRTTMEIILALYSAIREAAGDMQILGCNTIPHAAAGIFEAQRTGDDTSGREWERTRKMGVNTLAFRGLHHGAFYAADPDCVGVTQNIPWRLNRQWLDLAARSGTVLSVSIDPKTVGIEQKRDVAKAFEIAARKQPLLEPLDWLHTTCPTEYLLGGEFGERVRYHWDEWT